MSVAGTCAAIAHEQHAELHIDDGAGTGEAEAQGVRDAVRGERELDRSLSAGLRGRVTPLGPVSLRGRGRSGS